MKRTFWNTLLSLLLVMSLAPAARAAALDTTKLTITQETDKTVVTVAAESEEVLVALHTEGKTAKLTIPTVFTGNPTVYVLKDNTTVVEHSWIDENSNQIQFAVPGAGTYEIRQGTLPSLEQQLEDKESDIVLAANDTLADNYTVADATTIYANGNKIVGADGSKSLTAEGNLTLKDLNGDVDVFLDAGDGVTFGTDGKVTITAAISEKVGYGSVKVTAPENGEGNTVKMVTHTYFLLPGQTMVIMPDGTFAGGEVFAVEAADAVRPTYRVNYETHDNSHHLNTSGKIMAKCNGLYDHYTTITLTLQGTTGEKTLAAKIDGKDIVYASGIRVSEGSTILTLDDSYLNTLPVGEHTLTFSYDDGGKATGILKITQTVYTADTTNPKTGDPVLLAAAVMQISAMMLVLVIPCFERKRY